LTKFQHALRKATWDDESGRWILQVEDLVAKKTIEDRAEVVINATGFLK